MGGKLKDEKGQAIVEFALVLPIVLLIMCIIFELGWLCYGKLALENMVREGARAGSVAATLTESAAVANQRINAMTPDYLEDIIIVSISYSDAAFFRNGDITVNISADMQAITPISGIVGIDEFHLESQCVMKMN